MATLLGVLGQGGVVTADGKTPVAYLCAVYFSWWYSSWVNLDSSFINKLRLYHGRALSRVNMHLINSRK